MLSRTQCLTGWGTRTRLGIATTLPAVGSRRRNTFAQQDHGSSSTLITLPSSERCGPSLPFTAPASIPDSSAPPPGKVTSSEYAHPRNLTCTRFQHRPVPIPKAYNDSATPHPRRDPIHRDRCSPDRRAPKYRAPWGRPLAKNVPVKGLRRRRFQYNTDKSPERGGSSRKLPPIGGGGAAQEAADRRRSSAKVAATKAHGKPKPTVMKADKLLFRDFNVIVSSLETQLSDHTRNELRKAFSMMDKDHRYGLRVESVRTIRPAHASLTAVQLSVFYHT